MKMNGLEKADPNSINSRPKKRRLFCKSFFNHPFHHAFHYSTKTLYGNGWKHFSIIWPKLFIIVAEI